MNLEELAAACNRLSTADLTGYTDAEITAQLDELAAGCRVRLLGPPRDSNQTWFRGVPCASADGVENLHACIYRTRGSIDDYGRAHVLNGDSVFYASWNRITVVRELDPSPGQFRQIIAVRPPRHSTARELARRMRVMVTWPALAALATRRTDSRGRPRKRAQSTRRLEPSPATLCSGTSG
jgi:hypothetical protein